MITKLENGLYKIDCAVDPRKPNMNGIKYDLESYMKAISEIDLARMKLTCTPQEFLNRDAVEGYRDAVEGLIIRLTDVIANVIEIHYESETPYLIIRPISEMFESYTEIDCYAGARLIGNRNTDTKMIEIEYFTCWDIVPASACNWK